VKLQFDRSKDQIAQFLLIGAAKFDAEHGVFVYPSAPIICAEIIPQVIVSQEFRSKLGNPAFHIGEAFVFLKAIASYP
jgi:hypothetical protein